MIAGVLDGCDVDKGAAATAACLRRTNSSVNLLNSLQFFSRWFERSLPFLALNRCILPSEFIFSRITSSSRSLLFGLLHSRFL